MWQTTNLGWLHQVKTQYLLGPISFHICNDRFAFLSLEILLFHYLPMRKSKFIGTPWQPSWCSNTCIWLRVHVFFMTWKVSHNFCFLAFLSVLPVCCRKNSSSFIWCHVLGSFSLWSLSLNCLVNKKHWIAFGWKFLFLLFLYNTWIAFWLLEFLNYDKYGAV